MIACLNYRRKLKQINGFISILEIQAAISKLKYLTKYKTKINKNIIYVDFMKRNAYKFMIVLFYRNSWFFVFMSKIYLIKWIYSKKL
jgi:hypothetical protein